MYLQLAEKWGGGGDVRVVKWGKSIARETGGPAAACCKLYPPLWFSRPSLETAGDVGLFRPFLAPLRCINGTRKKVVKRKVPREVGRSYPCFGPDFPGSRVDIERRKLRESRLADLLWQSLLHEKVHEARLPRIALDLVVVRRLTGSCKLDKMWPLPIQAKRNPRRICKCEHGAGVVLSGLFL